ncbi:hypothetical protein FRC01_007695 [Tulasnella sp. 417]|nr:hypothetical protein FRC01_007695 [Tulasnella sp. 417]
MRFAALSVVLAASSAVLASSNVSLNPRDLIARQTATPSTCQDECTPATDQLSKCGTDLNCMCGSALASTYAKCLECGYAATTTDLKTSLSQAWDGYVQGCQSVGVTVTVKPNFSGSSSSSSSSTGTNSNTGSNSGLNSSSSGNDASRSTSLGFAGLGALAFAVSSLF